ncbi:MAG: 30S ribosomal protein S21 [Patescibacteria group bacterium]
MTEVKRKKGESFESLLRRFNSRVQMSGRLIQAKKVRFLPPKENVTRKKSAALKRIKIKTKIDYMLRAGKIKEEDLRRPKRGMFKK